MSIARFWRGSKAAMAGSTRPTIKLSDQDRTRLALVKTHPQSRNKPAWRDDIIRNLDAGHNLAATVRRTGKAIKAVWHW